VPLDSGKMRHVVRIEQRATTQDAAGEPALTWTLFAQRRASIVRTPGRELWSSEERQGRIPTLFRLRYLAGVLPAMRVIHGDKVFNILSAIDPDGMRAELVLNTEEHVEEAQ
jgi:head-tail adaptor